MDALKVPCACGRADTHALSGYKVCKLCFREHNAKIDFLRKETEQFNSAASEKLAEFTELTEQTFEAYRRSAEEQLELCRSHIADLNAEIEHQKNINMELVEQLAKLQAAAVPSSRDEIERQIKEKEQQVAKLEQESKERQQREDNLHVIDVLARPTKASDAKKTPAKKAATQSATQSASIKTKLQKAALAELKKKD